MFLNTRFLGFAVALAALVLSGSQALAVPYASGVRNTTGTTYEFILNESADNVTVQRDGGNAVDLGALAAGRHTFDLGGFSTFDVQVAKDTPADWTELSDAANLHTYFFRPTGLVVNQDPASPFFGTIYVSHPIAAALIPNVTQRETGEGIYSLSADRISVDLANNFAAIAEANDETIAVTPPGWTVTGNSGSSPWRLTLDDGNNLIVADFSDQNGGIKYASPDLTTGGLILANEDGVLPLLINGAGQEVHGSILSKPSVTGTVGTDLTVWAIDEDYDLDGDTFNVEAGEAFAQTSTFHPLRWDVGSATNYDQPPTIVINKEMMDIDDDMGTPDTSDDFNDTVFTLPPESIGGGVVVNNLHYEEQFDKFYITQSRTHGNESGLFIVTADGVDGNSPTVDWSSKRFSFDNGLDGNNSLFDPGGGEPSRGGGIQDIFRNIDDVIISADGSTMYVSRLRQFGPDDFDPDPEADLDGDNPVLGLDSNLPGGVLVIPLDENGIPDIQIDDNGTPNDTSDDFLSNVESIPLEILGRTIRNQLGLDAAGNVYSVDNNTERLQVFSPGGNTLAITSSDGTFDLQAVGIGLDGDFNNDGIVNAADYTVWRDNLGATEDGSILNGNGNGGIVDATDYNLWKTSFGNMSGSGALNLATSVPEPSSWMILALLVTCGFAVWRP